MDHPANHAVLRFLERAYGMGELIAAARDEMERGVMPAIDFSAPVAIVHGCRLIIREGSVVTVLPKGVKCGDRARAHRRMNNGELNRSGQ